MNDYDRHTERFNMFMAGAMSVAVIMLMLALLDRWLA